MSDEVDITGDSDKERQTRRLMQSDSSRDGGRHVPCMMKGSLDVNSHNRKYCSGIKRKKETEGQKGEINFFTLTEPSCQLLNPSARLFCVGQYQTSTFV